MSTLKGSKNFYDYELIDNLNYNLRMWLEYGLLEKGAYTVAKFNSPSSGYCVLKRVHDDRYGDNKVFEGIGPSWVWESGVSVPSGYPNIFQVSGVYVNNVFFPTSTTGTYSHVVDYRNGRVIFNNNVPAASSVKAEYVYRDIDVFITNTNKWNIIIDEYQKRYDDLESLSPSGMAEVLKENRVWLPAVVVDTSKSTMRPLQLGGGEIESCQVDWYIFSDKPFSNNRLCDLLLNQFQHSITLFDVSLTPRLYNLDGSVTSGSLTYPVLSDRNNSYFWAYSYIDHVTGGSNPSLSDLYTSNVTHYINVERYLNTY